jgi:hypothetical protein
MIASAFLYQNMEIIILLMLASLTISHVLIYIGSLIDLNFQYQLSSQNKKNGFNYLI